MQPNQIFSSEVEIKCIPVMGKESILYFASILVFSFDKYQKGCVILGDGIV